MSFFIGSNGYLTFDLGDSGPEPVPIAHFSLPRIAALFKDLDPEAGGVISWQQLGNRVVVTFQDVPEYRHD